jgi:hypothetical protein
VRDLAAILDAMVRSTAGVSGFGGTTDLRMICPERGSVSVVYRAPRCRRTGTAARWLGLIRSSETEQAVAVMLVIDARSLTWRRGVAPTALFRGPTGFDADRQPVLWFRGSGSMAAGRRATAVGAFSAADLVDGARASVRLGLSRRRARMRLSLEPSAWRLSAPLRWSFPTDSEVLRQLPVADERLTFSIRGWLRTTSPALLRQWPAGIT